LALRWPLQGLVLLGCISWGLTGSAAASDHDGSGPSYWGEIPAQADSISQQFDDPPLETWEYPVEGVWLVAQAPFQIVRLGYKATVEFLEDSGILGRISRLLAPVDLPFGFSLSGVAGRLSGSGGSVTFHHDDLGGTGTRLRAKAAVATRDNQQFALGMMVPTAINSYLERGGGCRRRGTARYCGSGPNSSDGRASFYTQESAWVGASYRQSLGQPGLALELEALYSTMDARDPNEVEERNKVDDECVDELPNGYRSRSDGGGLGLKLMRDTTVENGRPNQGGLQRLKATAFLSADPAQADFVVYRAEAQQFFRLWRDRSFAVRGFVSWIEADDGSLHFQRLTTNDDPDLLRGYEDFRFRDQGMTALSLEYRYPIWDYRDPGQRTLDAYLFYDGGQVFGDRREIAEETLTHSYGFGFRLSANGGFQGRLEFGWSEEDVVVRLHSDQPFQYAKQGLFHGRVPIPAR
jgi:outer membrane protein assembly factor BamA